MTMPTITLARADERAAHYGITYESVTVHRVTGAGVHNRNSNHKVVVWDNTGRLNTDAARPGTYIGPDGSGTDSPVTILLSAQATIISAERLARAAVGVSLQIGDRVRLAYIDGTTVEAEVVARRLRDPMLVPVTNG